jgi:hypothetical protein
MSSRRARFALLVVGLTALAVPAAANPYTGVVMFVNGYGWWAIINAVIVLVEWPLLVWIARCNAEWALLGVAAANYGSGLLLAYYGEGRVVRTGVSLDLVDIWGFTLLVTVPLEYAAVCAALALGGRISHRPQALGWRLLGAVVAVNILTCPAGIVSPEWLPVWEEEGSCLQNLDRIGEAMTAYRAKHGGHLPDAPDMATLAAALAPYGLRPESLHCPQRESRWALYDYHPTRPNYELVVPLSSAMDGHREAGAPRIAIVADDKPRHYRDDFGWYRKVLYLQSNPELGFLSEAAYARTQEHSRLMLQRAIDPPEVPSHAQQPDRP